MRSGNLALFSAVCREYRLLCHPDSKDSCSSVIGDCLKVKVEETAQTILSCLLSYQDNLEDVV